MKGNVFPIGFNLNQLHSLEKVVVVEGVATGVSVHLATSLPVVVVFSATFGLEAMNRMREKTQAKFIIAFDNDKNGVGQKES